MCSSWLVVAQSVPIVFISHRHFMRFTVVMLDLFAVRLCQALESDKQNVAASPTDACACLTADSTKAATVRAQFALTELSVPSDYGLNGCQAYDRDAQMVPECSVRQSVLQQPMVYHRYQNICTNHVSQKQDCAQVSATPAFCRASWCYIDPAACVENATRCLEEGGNVGSGMHPSCRSRRFDKSWFFSGTSEVTSLHRCMYVAIEEYRRTDGGLLRCISATRRADF